MDDFLEQLRNMPADLRNIRPAESPVVETEETRNEITEIVPQSQSAIQTAKETTETVLSGLSAIRRTRMDRVDMQNYVAEQSQRLAQLAIEAVEGMQSDVINTADGKLAQAYATLIGTASKALDTVNTIAQEQSRREHDIEMEEIKFQNKKRLAGETEDHPKNVTNNLNIIATREEMFKMMMEKNRPTDIEIQSDEIQG